MVLFVCSVVDHTQCLSVAAPHVATSLFLPLFNYKGQQFNFICDLLLNRPAAMWNPFVQWEHITPLTLTCKVNCHKFS